MATISRPHGNYNAGDLIIASQINDDFNTVYSEVNGGLDNDNIKPYSLQPDRIVDEYRYDNYLKEMPNFVYSGFTLSTNGANYTIGNGTCWILSKKVTSPGGSGTLSNNEEGIIYCDSTGTIVKSSSILNEHCPLYYLYYNGTSITSWDLRQWSPAASFMYYSYTTGISTFPWTSSNFVISSGNSCSYIKVSVIADYIYSAAASNRMNLKIQYKSSIAGTAYELASSDQDVVNAGSWNHPLFYMRVGLPSSNITVFNVVNSVSAGSAPGEARVRILIEGHQR